MIRINLLPPSETKKRAAKTGGGLGEQAFPLLLIGLALIEVLALYFWYTGMEDEVAVINQKKNRIEQQVRKLEKLKKQAEEREKITTQLSRQNIIFDELRSAKTGPSEMLQFLSYVLTKKEETLYSRNEIKAQEAAKWSTNWNPENVWLDRITQDGREVVIKGTARTRQDVAEFVRRLESSIYFLVPDLPLLVETKDEIFGDMTLVAFEVVAFLNYNQDGTFEVAAGEVPERLEKYVSKPAEPEAKPEEKGGKGKGGDEKKGKPGENG